MDHLEHNQIETLSIYWQGGEVMTLPPEWFEEAHGIIQEIAVGRNRQVAHYLQSNMIAYTSKWNRVLAEMFGNSVGSSMDFPNLHRKLKGGGPKEYDRIWARNVQEATEAGIEVGVIAIPNERTLEMGAERFYSHFVDELGIKDFQINTPFPGGSVNDVKMGYPLDTGRLSGFLADLAQSGWSGVSTVGCGSVLLTSCWIISSMAARTCCASGGTTASMISFASIPRVTWLNVTAG